MPEFYTILARKISKIPEFYVIFARKMSEFYIIIARKIFFPNFRGARAFPAPVSYAYGGEGPIFLTQFYEFGLPLYMYRHYFGDDRPSYV